MTTRSRAFRSARAKTARCWCIATLAAISATSSLPSCANAVLGGPGDTSARIASPTKEDADADARKRTAFALAIWRASQPAEATLVQTYLAARGIDLPLPDALRFHAGLKHPSGDIWPAMVALVTNGVDATPLAIHRTFLARDGSGKAPVDPQKMMLGPCRGGVVRLATPWRAPLRTRIPPGALLKALRRCADGRRRHRDLPRRHAGDRPSGLGGAVDRGAARARSSAKTCAT